MSQNQFQPNELATIFNNHELAEDIYMDQAVNLKCIQEHQRLVKYINNFHDKIFNEVAISMGDPKNLQRIGDRVIRVFKRQIDCKTSKAKNAYDDIEQALKRNLAT